MVRKIAYVILPILILASFGVLPLSLVMGQVGNGTPTSTVTVTAVPAFIYTPVVIDVSEVVTDEGVFTEEVTGESADEVLAITIPEGTTGTTEEGDPISQIVIAPKEEPPPPPADTEVIGLVYSVYVVTSEGVISEGVTFDQPITLTMAYDESQLAEGVAETDLRPAWWDEDSQYWIPFVDFAIDTELNEIYIALYHLSEYAILAPTAPPAPGGGGGGGIRVSPPLLVTAGGVFTQPVLLYSEDAMLVLSFGEGTVAFTGEGDPFSELVAGEVGETYIVEMGDVYIVKMDDPPPPPEDARIVGVVYDFGPDGATFDPPITLTLTYDESLIPDGVVEEHLVPVWWDVASEQWVPLEVFIVNSKLNIITAPISHFTPFTILAYLHPVEFATFAASNLLVMPTEVDVGESVYIVISVTNTGGQSGSCVIVLKINGLVEASEEVTIAAGDSELVSFSIVKNTAGTYSLEVAGFTGIFTVKGEPAPPTVTLPPPSPPVDWTIIGGIIAAVLLAAAGLIYSFRVGKRYKYAAVTYPVEAERLVAPPTVAPPTVVPPAPEPVAYPPTGISMREVIGRIMAVVAAPVVISVRILVSILRAIVRGMVVVTRSTAVGTRVVGSKAAVGVSAVSVGGSRVLVNILRAIGRGVLVVSRSTAAGTRVVSGKAAVGVTATATGSSRVLVNILRSIGRVVLMVARSTAAGTRVVSGKAAVAVTATATGSSRVLVNTLRSIGRGVVMVTRSTAAGTRVVGGKAAVGVTATATGSSRVLVSILRAIGRAMPILIRATVAGVSVVVSWREVVGRILTIVTAVIVKWIRFLVSQLVVVGSALSTVVTTIAKWAHRLLSKWI